MRNSNANCFAITQDYNNIKCHNYRDKSLLLWLRKIFFLLSPRHRLEWAGNFATFGRARERDSNDVEMWKNSFNVFPSPLCWWWCCCSVHASCRKWTSIWDSIHCISCSPAIQHSKWAENLSFDYRNIFRNHAHKTPDAKAVEFSRVSRLFSPAIIILNASFVQEIWLIATSHFIVSHTKEEEQLTLNG